MDYRKNGDRRSDDRRGGSRRGDDRRRDDRRSDDRRSDDRSDRNKKDLGSSRRYMFTDTDSQQQKGFKRPEPPKRRSPSPQKPTPAATQERHATQQTPSFQPIIPQSITPAVQALTRDQLNKLNSKIVKAKLMGSSNVEELEREYQAELEKFEQAENGGNNVAVLPSLDSQGRLYDYALKQGSQEHEALKGKKKYEDTHDKVTGERIRYGTSDDILSLAEMVRQEKGGGKSSNMDMEFANRIMSDATFEV